MSGRFLIQKVKEHQLLAPGRISLISNAPPDPLHPTEPGKLMYPVVQRLYCDLLQLAHRRCGNIIKVRPYDLVGYP
jgi:hypothetical protein